MHGDLVKHLWRVHTKQMSFTPMLHAQRKSKRALKEEDYEHSNQSTSLVQGFSQTQPREFDRF